MKRLAILLAASIPLLFCAGCQKVKTPHTKATVTVATQPSGMQSPLEGTKTITIWPTAHWEAAADVDWVTVEPSSGERGTQEVKLHYEENFTPGVRVAVITFTAAEGSDTYVLTQNF